MPGVAAAPHPAKKIWERSRTPMPPDANLW
jgi:hypothetical protein